MNPVEEQADDDELLTSYLDGELDSVEIAPNCSSD